VPGSYLTFSAELSVHSDRMRIDIEMSLMRFGPEYSTKQNSLIPATRRGFAAWLEWCFYIVTELDSASLYVM
jgi:hypothetical protein